MFSNNQLMVKPDREHQVRFLSANIKVGGTLWKEGNTDLFFAVLRKYSLMSQAKQSPLQQCLVGGERLFSKPSEAEEQLSRAGLRKGGSLGASWGLTGSWAQ